MRTHLENRPQRKQRRVSSSGERTLPWDLLLICTAGFVATAVARVHTLVPMLPFVRPVLVFAGLGILLYMTNRKGLRSERYLRNPLGYLLLFVVCWAVAGLPFSIYLGSSVLFLFDELLRVAVLALLVAAAIRNLHDLKRLLLVYAMGAVAFSVFAALPGSYRYIGAGGYDANDAAFFLVSSLPLLLFFLVRSRSQAIRLLSILGLVGCTIAVVRSGSRGGFLAFLIVIAYLILFFGGIKPIVRLAVVSAVGAMFVYAASGESDYWSRMDTLRDLDSDYNVTSPTGRKEIWKRGIGYTLDNPVFGVGVNNFRVAEGRHPFIAARIEQGIGTRYAAAHSTWIQAAAELGIPGLLAFIGLFWVSFAYVRRLSRHARRVRDPETLEAAQIGQALAGVLVALAAGGTFLSQAYGYPLWAAFGLMLGLMKLCPIGTGAGAGRYSRARLRQGYLTARPHGSRRSAAA